MNGQHLLVMKIILQTHHHPTKEKKPKTRAHGYYGYNNENISPLTDKDIPSWASEFRNEVSPGEGCSVYIPYTNYNKGLTDATIIALIANFYMAFKKAKLEATVDHIKINSNNIDLVYEKYRKNFLKIAINLMMI